MGATDIRTELRRFLHEHPSIAETRIGREAANDPSLVADMLRRGRVPTPRVADRLRTYLASMEGR